MRKLGKSVLLTGLLAGLTVSPVVSATNGMFLIGFGSKQRGMGGVSIAYGYDDPFAGATNPAAIVNAGTRGDMAGDFFLPDAEAALNLQDPNATVIREKSTANKFLIPGMAMSMKFNRDIFIGFSGVGVGGGGSRYNTNLYNSLTNANPDATLGVNLMVAQMNPTFAYRLSKTQYIGASLVIGVQQFRAYGLDYFSNFTATGLNTNELTNAGNDHAWGYGLRLGWLGKFMKKKLQVGVAATSKVYMNPFGKYGDLFAEKGDFDTPSNVGVGISYKFSDKLRAGFDVTRTFYSSVAAVSNTTAQKTIGGSPFPVSQEVNALGRDEGLGFEWQNQTVYKLGAEYDYSDKLTLRAGWNYGKSPIPEERGAVLFSIVAPATVEHHLTMGASYRASRQLEFSVAYMHAFENKQYGPTFIGNVGEIKMRQNSLSMGVAYIFY